MNKLKEKMNSLYLILKKSMEQFPLTMITIIILTLIYVIDLDGNVIGGTTLRNIMLFGVTFANGAFLTETLTSEKKKKIIGYVISAVLALAFTYIIAEPNILSKSIMNWIEKLFTCSMISTFALSIYFNYKKSEKTFEKYLTSVFVNILKASIIYGILALGSIIVTAVFIFLILDGKDYTLLARIEILIFGIYYVPALLYSLCNIEEKVSKFSKVVIKYVLGTLVIVAFAIIYIYIIKIIILRDIPSNQIFRILTALFILGLPIWTMIESFNEDTAIDKINKWLPKLFIPFIALQIYSIGVRILENGITENRYLCIVLIIFEIIYTIIKLRKKEVGKTILVFIALTIISTVMPYINMNNISRISQYNNLKIFKEKTDYTEEEKQKIYGGYSYLQNTDEGNSLIKSLLTENEEEEIRSFRKQTVFEYDSNSDTIQRINGYADVEVIDVAEYKKLYMVDSFNYREKQGDINEVFGKLEIKLNDNETIYVNISEKINEYMQYGENLDRNFKNINEIQIDNNKKLILKNISISYDKVNKKVGDYSIVGYLLEN